MRGRIRLGFSVILVIAVIVLVYSLFAIMGIESGDISGYLTKDERLFSVDYTDCYEGNVIIILRNLDSVDVVTKTDLEIVRENDNNVLVWDRVIAPGKTATFSDDGCKVNKEPITCRYSFISKKYGIKSKINVRCSG